MKGIRKRKLKGVWCRTVGAKERTHGRTVRSVNVLRCIDVKAC